MSEVIGSGTIKVTADNRELKAGLEEAKRAVRTFGSDLGNTTQAGAAKAQASIQRYVDRLKLAADNAGKTASELKLLDLAQRGASESQLAAAAAALKTIDAYKLQQQEMRKAAGAAQDMSRAAAAVERMSGPMNFVTSSIVGAVSALAGVSLTATFSSLVNQIDSLNDAADATGSTVEKISALEQVALRTGTTVEASVVPAIDKLNQALRAKSDSEQARALQAIGLSAEELRKVDPADALRQVAQALQQYEDNGDKARLVQALLGKSARELSPFLKDLAEKGDLVAVATSAQAAEAEKFNQQLALLRTSATNVGRSIVAEMLPSLNQMLLLFQELRSGPGLAASIGEVFRGNAFGSATDGLAYYNKEIADIDKRLAALRADKRPLLSAFNAPQINDLEKQRAALDRFATAYRNVLNAGSAGAGRGTVVPGGGDRKPVKFTSDDDDTTKKADPYETALKSLRERIDLLGKEGELEKVNAEIEAGRFGRLSEQRRLALQYAAIQIDQYHDEQASLKEVEKARDAATQALSRASLAALQGLATYEAGNRSLQEEIEILGADAKARAVIENARLQALITTKETQLAERELTGIGDERNEVLQREIDLLKERQQLNMGKAIKETDIQTREIAERAKNTLAESIEDGILNGFRDSKSIARVFLDELKAQFARTYLRPVIQPVVQGLQDAAGSVLSSLLGSLVGGLKMDAGGYGITNDATGSLVSLGLGGGRQAGGPVYPNTLHPVTEDGRPELLDIGGKRYLMTGDQGGWVTSNEDSMRAVRTAVTAQAPAAQAVKLSMPAINVINNTGTPAKASVQQREDGGMDVLLEAMESSMADRVANGQGPLHGAISGRFGLRPSFTS